VAFSVRKHKSRWINDQKRHILVTLPGSSNEHIRAGESQRLILVELSVRSFATINFTQINLNDCQPPCCLDSPSSPSSPPSPRLHRSSSELPLSSFTPPVTRPSASEFLPVPPLETERRYTTSLVLRLPPASRSPRVTTRS
jgi:hypothetical protein